jgi:cell division protein FtsI/penicillin-binding protein 2
MTRLRIFHHFIISGFIFLWGTLIYHQIIHVSKYQQLSQINRIRVLPQSASRGCISDRNGNILAGNALSYNLLLMPGQMDRMIGQVSKLASILLSPEESLKAIYTQGYTTPFLPVLLAEDISLSQAVAIGQLFRRAPSGFIPWVMLLVTSWVI